MLFTETRRAAITTKSQKVILDDGLPTTVHVARYARTAIQPKLVLFEKETRLPEWCRENNIHEALVGGFFLRKENKPLGELWLDGIQQPSVSFAQPWHLMRGSLHVTESDLQIDHRKALPADPFGDLLQAGPLLVKDGLSLLSTPNDNEGFSEAWHQFDSDITEGRHPRAAIGMNETHIFSVVCDGRSTTDAGMTLAEMAEYMLNQGCTHALNLDGGGSASLISQGKLQNIPRGDGREYSDGRPIFSAITFQNI